MKATLLTLTRAIITFPQLILCLPLAAWGADAELRAGGMNATQTFREPMAVELVRVIEREDLSGVENALAHGANINAVGESGQTPLHWSLLKLGIAERTVRLLLSKGADPNYPMSNGESPLHLTAGGNRHDLLELFLKTGGNPNVQTRIGRTPLMDAIASQYDQNVNLLLKFGADPNLGETCSSTVANARFDYTVALLRAGLTKGLSYCGRLVKRRVIQQGGPREKYRQQVFDILAERGIHPPFTEQE
ncbi:hypothetical protein CKO44_25010 [Rubrivivax gelatinosus]|uniref:ankyrin repeat domain-containing protein n=1 Tax=Rubrivivax gelatinosus TaxID=28068 RepID=UPI001903AB0D|nr:ankyrin repeat domain-containing protein [Rubrivivax gelatinosus]MBK1616702.1 hypothetical protein [Rubrivivax gelatinosus]